MFPQSQTVINKMENNDLVSVVIPCYNRKARVLACLSSVLSQSYERLEVIVVDDGSTDNVQELFRSVADSRVRFLRYEQNRGACYARNYGAERSKGKYIAFQDSDDVWYPDKIEKQLAFIKESGSDLCFCGMDRVSAEGNGYYFPVHGFSPERALEQFLAENRAGTQTMLMHRHVWESLRFDESFRRYQDWDFAIRAAAGFSLAYLPIAMVRSEVGGDSISFAVKSYPALVKLYSKHEALYKQYPAADAVMNRRMGKRLHKTDPRAAAKHFAYSFRLSHSVYDLCYLIADTFQEKKKDG